MNAANSTARSHSFSAAFLVHNKVVDFLIDTGAAVSLLPASWVNRLKLCLNPSPLNLSSVDGRPLNVLGECPLSLCSKQLRRTFFWTFVIAEIREPLLGADFLSHFALLVDCKHARVIDRTTLLKSICSVRASPANPSPLIALPEIADQRVRDLLLEFSALYSQTSPMHDSSQVTTQHIIETTTDLPVFAKARQLSNEKLAAAKTEFDNLLQQGLIRPSKSPWASPLHMVPKADGSWRPCGDYRRLNAITKPDRYPVPHLSSLKSKLHGATVFSKLDLLRAFHQIPMAPSDIEKTAVITSFGLFEFLYMPFGLRNAAQTLQRLMDSMFRDLPFTMVYLDDILIFSKDADEHLSHLRQVFELLSTHGLRISPSKCEFMLSEIDFLGHHITANGTQPKPKKIDAIVNYQKPVDYASLRRFMGMIGFYRHFIPNFAATCHPLYELLGSTNQRNHTLDWSEQADTAFNTVKDSLTSAETLCHPDPTSNEFLLVTDASNFALGSALHQLVDGQPRPISFFSKKLSASERAYSAFDRELLAAYRSVLHFKHLIEGRQVHINTDHKPLVAAFYSTKPAQSDRQQRQLLIISELASSMTYIRGKDNIVADALSRSLNAVSVDFPDLHSLALAQQSCEEIQTYAEKLKKFHLADNTELLCNCDLPSPRPFVPKLHRRALFDSLHSLSHPGVKSSIALITSRYFWPEMRKQIKLWVNQCENCQQSKITRHHHPTYLHSSYPQTDRFQTVHMDIVGPLSPAQTLDSSAHSPARYIVTFIDRATRWFECSPVPDITAETIAHAFLSTWVNRFGVPLTLVTDQGRQFESTLFSHLSRITGFQRMRCSPYHPQSNGIIERFHRTLKTALKARKQDWLLSLPLVELSLRAIPNDSGFCPFTAVTGSPILAPHMHFDNVSHDFETNSQYIERLAKCVEATDFTQLARGRHHTPTAKRVNLAVKPGDLVWLRVDRVRRPLEAPYEGPLEVVTANYSTVTVRYPSGRLSTVSKERVKIANIVRRDKLFRSTPPRDSTERQQTDPQPAEAPTTRTRKATKRVTFARHHHYLRPRPETV